MTITISCSKSALNGSLLQIEFYIIRLKSDKFVIAWSYWNVN